MTEQGHDALSDRPGASPSQAPDEPLLSNEESSALLDAMGGGARRGLPPIEATDLAAPERHLRNALRAGDRAAQDVARQFGRHLLQQLGAQVSLQEMPAEIAPYSLVSSTIGAGAIVATLRTPRVPFAGLLVVGPLLAAFFLDRRLGAPVRADDDELHPRTDLGAIDRRLAQPLVRHLAEEFGLRWCGRRGALHAEPVLRNVEEVPELPPVEPVLRMTVRTSFGAHADEIVLVLTAPGVRDTIPEEAAPPPPRAPSTDRRHLAARVANTVVEAIARLGSTRTSVREVLALVEGDVVRLDSAPSGTIPVWVDGVPVVEGRPVVSHGNLAIEVTDVF